MCSYNEDLVLTNPSNHLSNFKADVLIIHVTESCGQSLAPFFSSASVIAHEIIPLVYDLIWNADENVCAVESVELICVEQGTSSCIEILSS